MWRWSLKPEFFKQLLLFCVILETFDYLFLFLFFTLKVWILRHLNENVIKYKLTVKESFSLHQNPSYRLSTGFSLKPVACKKEREKSGGKLTVHRLHSGGIRVVCVFADHCKTGPLWRRLPDCHSAGFSNLNKVGVSNRTSIDQEIPPQFRKLS